MSVIELTLVGGPTVLIEAGGFRFLTDPTFDEPGSYALPHVTLEKTQGPAVSADEIGPVDAVLLSHDQHADNLDNSGRVFLQTAPHVFTTKIGAERLGGTTTALAPWATSRIVNAAGQEVEITATPARHGPAGIEPFSGDVIGFVLTFSDGHTPAIYITGDTVWFDGVADVAKRFQIGVVVVFGGAAQTRGAFHLTMNTNDAIETAHVFKDALIVPVHVDSWAHFTQDKNDIEAAFKLLGYGERLRLLEPGKRTSLAQ